jgi:hypothetical protein
MSYSTENMPSLYYEEKSVNSTAEKMAVCGWDNVAHTNILRGWA